MSTSCPGCGITFHNHEATDAQARISDLEAQVRLLNNRASMYVDRLADYEEETRSLRMQCARLQKENGSTDTTIAPSQPQEKEQNRNSLPPPPTPLKDPVVERKALNRQSASRLANLTSYFPGRRRDVEDPPPVPPLTPAFNQSTPTLGTPASDYFPFPSAPLFTDPNRQTQSMTLIGLQSKLENERHLREEAEQNLTNAQSELEELTAQLFGQANEMVAEERRARAALEERVKLLETTDKDKRKRLERLEGAVARIERVRKLVVEHERELEGVREREKGVEQVAQRRVSEKVKRMTAAR